MVNRRAWAPALLSALLGVASLSSFAQPVPRDLHPTEPGDGSCSGLSLPSPVMPTDPLVPPKEARVGKAGEVRGVFHVIAEAHFEGRPDDAPLIKVVYSTASAAHEEAIKAYMSRYRLPCRLAGQGPYVAEQSFVFRVEHDSLRFKNTELSLRDFLGLIANPHLLQADFDLNDMACPFAVFISMRQPRLPNSVSSVGERNAKRTAFLKWLSTLALAVTDARQAEDLFNTELTINVPCGAVRLSPPAQP
jgi:hypothetical protein